MKLFAFAALVTLAATPLVAQTAPAPAPTAPAPSTTAAATKFNLDTPIEQLVADEKAKGVLMTVLGSDITQNPFYDQIKGMSFNQVQPISQGQLTDDTMKKLAEGLAAIK